MSTTTNTGATLDVYVTRVKEKSIYKNAKYFNFGIGKLERNLQILILLLSYYYYYLILLLLIIIIIILSMYC